MHLALVGNIIYDTLIHIDKPLSHGESHTSRKIVNRFGGIFNFLRAFNNDITVSIHSAVGDDYIGEMSLAELPTKYDISDIIKAKKDHTTSAFVIIDPNRNERTGIVNWGACSKRSNWNLCDADWLHIMYLDCLSIPLNIIEKFNGTISADLCDIEKYNDYREYHQYIDYYTVSKPKFFNIFKSSKSRKGMIVHDPSEIVYVDCQTNIRIDLNPIIEPNLNVVGAGDYFSASCIQQLMLSHRLDLEAAHHHTLKLLKSQS